MVGTSICCTPETSSNDIMLLSIFGLIRRSVVISGTVVGEIFCTSGVNVVCMVVTGCNSKWRFVIIESRDVVVISVVSVVRLGDYQR